MRKLIILFILLFITGCASKPKEYTDITKENPDVPIFKYFNFQVPEYK